jgi:hypothetical protein
VAKVDLDRAEHRPHVGVAMGAADATVSAETPDALILVDRIYHVALAVGTLNALRALTD